MKLTFVAVEAIEIIIIAGHGSSAASLMLQNLVGIRILVGIGAEIRHGSGGVRGRGTSPATGEGKW